MATAAESHMTQRSERDGARGWGVPADDRGGEKRDGNEVELEREKDGRKEINDKRVYVCIYRF